MSGQRLGNYLIEDRLGQGGVATVWRARHRYLGTVHALKVLSRPSPKALTRLLREGRVQAQLQHPAVVPVTDIIVDEERVALAMPLITGGTLDEWMRRNGPLAPDRALALFRPILEAVVHAHAAGVLHRDIKPQNVLMEGEQPRVADFGIARLCDDDEDPVITRVGAPMGTLGFCSPEQWANASQVDGRADVFSLGALLYWILAGRAPFDEQTPTHTLRNTLTGSHPDLRSLVPDCPEAVAAAIHAAILPRPEDRPATALDFAALLGLDVARPARSGLARTERPSPPAGQAHAVASPPPVGAPAMGEAEAGDPASSPGGALRSVGGGGEGGDAMGLALASATTSGMLPFFELAPPSSETADDEGTLRSAPPDLLRELVAECAPRPTIPPDDAVAPVGAHLRAFRAGPNLGMAALVTGALLLGCLGLGLVAMRDAEFTARELMAGAQVAEGGPTAPPVEDWTGSLETAGEDLAPAAEEAPADRDASPARTGGGSAPQASSSTAPTDSRCPREGQAALGWWEVDRRGKVDVGDRIKVRRAGAVTVGRRSEDGVRLGAQVRCQLDRGQRVEVRSEPVAGADGAVLVEIFPTAISGG